MPVAHADRLLPPWPQKWHWYRCIVNCWSIGLATVLFGFDLQGWIAVIGGILLALITLFTGYDHVVQMRLNGLVAALPFGSPFG